MATFSGIGVSVKFLKAFALKCMLPGFVVQKLIGFSSSTRGGMLTMVGEKAILRVFTSLSMSSPHACVTLHLFSRVPISASMFPPVACSFWSNSDLKVSSGLSCGHSSLVIPFTCSRVPVFANATTRLESISAMLSTRKCAKTDFISAFV